MPSHASWGTWQGMMARSTLGWRKRYLIAELFPPHGQFLALGKTVPILARNAPADPAYRSGIAPITWRRHGFGRARQGKRLVMAATR